MAFPFHRLMASSFSVRRWDLSPERFSHAWVSFCVLIFRYVLQALGMQELPYWPIFNRYLVSSYLLFALHERLSRGSEAIFCVEWLLLFQHRAELLGWLSYTTPFLPTLASFLGC